MKMRGKPSTVYDLTYGKYEMRLLLEKTRRFFLFLKEIWLKTFELHQPLTNVSMHWIHRLWFKPDPETEILLHDRNHTILINALV